MSEKHLSQEELVWLAKKQAKDNIFREKVYEEVDIKMEKWTKRQKDSITNEEVREHEEKLIDKKYAKIKENSKDTSKEIEMKSHISECGYCRDKFDRMIGGPSDEQDC